jgi:hypothetical protein
MSIGRCRTIRTHCAILFLSCASSLNACASKTAPDPAPSSAAPNAIDQKVAEEAVLRVTDLKEGYKSTPYVRSDQERADDEELQSCLGRPPSVRQRTALAFSPVLSSGTQKRILASVEFVGTEAMASPDLAAQRGPHAASCIQTLQEQQFSRSGAKATVSVKTIRPSIGGPHSESYRITISVAAGNGADLTSFIDLVTVIRGRAEITAIFANLNSVISPEEQTSAITAMVERLRAAGR